MAVKTEKASEVKSLTATPTDSDKVLGYNSTNGAGFWTLSNFLNWIKNKTRSTIAAGDKTPVNSDAVNSALSNYFNVKLNNVNLNSNVYKDTTRQLKYYEIGRILHIVGSFTSQSLNAWSNLATLPYTVSNKYIKDIDGNNILYLKNTGVLQNAVALTEDKIYYFDYSISIS